MKAKRVVRTPSEVIQINRDQRQMIAREVFLYLVTITGVVVSPLFPALIGIIVYARIPEALPNAWHPVRIAAIMLAAALVTFAIEHKGDLAGKQKNFRQRILKHFAYGTMWSVVLQGIVDGIGIGVQ